MSIGSQFPFDTVCSRLRYGSHALDESGCGSSSAVSEPRGYDVACIVNEARTLAIFNSRQLHPRMDTALVQLGACLVGCVGERLSWKNERAALRVVMRGSAFKMPNPVEHAAFG